jgi:hypothetical protein
MSLAHIESIAARKHFPAGRAGFDCEVTISYTDGTKDVFVGSPYDCLRNIVAVTAPTGYATEERHAIT